MLKIQEFLRSGNTFAQLKEQFGINAKVDSEFPNLVLFKYSQIDSPMGEEIVQECRGIILDSDNDWKIISHPYDKFFNHGEGHAKPIDWESARVLEKLDGSCIQMYYYAGKWRVGTLGVPNAQCPVGNLSDKTFTELFWETFHGLGYILPNEYDYNEYTFVFELMTPYNRVVVPHKKAKLILHGMRDNSMDYELNVHYSKRTLANKLNWQIVQSYPLSSLDEVLKMSNGLDPMLAEGFVIVDKYFNRIKVKSPAYVALHHAVDGFSRKAFLEIIRNGETSEVLTHFPEYTKDFNYLKSRWEALVNYTNETYNRHKDIETQKDFALVVAKLRISGVLFALRSGKVESAEAAYRKMPVQNLLELIDMMP